MIRITVIPVARVVWEIRSAFSSTFVAVAPRTVTPRCGPDRGAGDSCMPTITWDDFAKVDIRVGRIVDVEDFPKARKPAYKLRIDFGELGVKTSSAQITKYYDKAELLGKLVLAVINFPPRQIANFFSEVLTLGVVLGDGDIVLVHPEREVPLGGRIA
jgi:tRNA-binding protein